MDLKDLFKAPENEDDDRAPQKESPLVSLQSDLKIYNDSIKEVSGEIIMEGISNYPIFITHQHIVNLGEPILDKDELNTNWSINASTLEECVEKGIIDKSKKERFIAQYKNPHEFMCLFVVVPEGANFVFNPYK